MNLRPEEIRGSSGTGVVDYRLARQQVIQQYRKGRLSKLDVCDAHPELRRAASGTCVSTARDMAKLSRAKATVACYVVEVCPACAWNHLTRVFHVGG